MKDEKQQPCFEINLCRKSGTIITKINLYFKFTHYGQVERVETHREAQTKRKGETERDRETPKSKYERHQSSANFPNLTMLKRVFCVQMADGSQTFGKV